MHRYLLLLLILFQFSCRKETAGVLVQDRSVITTSSLNKIRYAGPQAIIAGGVLYDHAAIYVYNDVDGLQEVPLPSDATQKEIFGLDISPSGLLMAVGYDASVFTSVDTGAHWDFIQNGSWKIFRDIAFRDSDTAFVASSKGFEIGGITLLNSTGDGSNILTTEKNFAIEDIDFVDQNVGYLCGYGAVMKTTDGGHTWTFTTAENDFFKSMCWKNEMEGVVVGYAGSILKTINGGLTWQRIRNGNSLLKKKIHYLAVECNSGNTCVAVGENGIVSVSYDFGANWVDVKQFTEKDLKGIGFKNEKEFAVVGAQGAFFGIKID